MTEDMCQLQNYHFAFMFSTIPSGKVAKASGSICLCFKCDDIEMWTG